MKNLNFLLVLFVSTGCPVARAYDVKEDISLCVIDQCADNSCRVETPEGWVDIERKAHHYEGKKIECPVWLVEPT